MSKFKNALFKTMFRNSAQTSLLILTFVISNKEMLRAKVKAKQPCPFLRSSNGITAEFDENCVWLIEGVFVGYQDDMKASLEESQIMHSHISSLAILMPSLFNNPKTSLFNYVGFDIMHFFFKYRHIILIHRIFFYRFFFWCM